MLFKPILQAPALGFVQDNVQFIGVRDCNPSFLEHSYYPHATPYFLCFEYLKVLVVSHSKSSLKAWLISWR